jgi:(p)ppGpp synthase/HD superfamily hydrolase
MDESLYRGFDGRAHAFFSIFPSLGSASAPRRSILKGIFISEVRALLHPSLREVNNLRKSFHTAFSAYQKKVRRSGEAFVFHPMRGSLVLAWAMKMFSVCDVTLLYRVLHHDSIEEADSWYEKLYIRSVIRITHDKEITTDVEHLTKHPGESDETYFFRILTCGRWQVILVKFVDRIDNIWTLTTKNEADVEKSRRKIRETEVWFPRLGEELTALLTGEFVNGKLSQDWLRLAEFLRGYLAFAVKEKREELGMT